MSATILSFGAGQARAQAPACRLFAPYAPPMGSHVTVTAHVASDSGRAVYDVEVVRHDGQGGYDVLATCGHADDAAYHARAIADAYGLEVRP